MTRILNPIYDASFKYLMEDTRAAKALLSALLRRKVTDISPMAHEHADQTRDRATGKDLGIYRIDYSASIETAEGGSESVCIELQKVWYETEIYRFRKYLGGQYSDPRNVESDSTTPRHIIAIYILGHNISETDSPIAYGFGGSLTDYDGRPIPLTAGGKGGYGNGKFVRSLTHDIIIVQVSRLPAKPRNAAERVLSVFDQRRVCSSDKHVIELPDDGHIGDDALNTRLLKGLCDSSLREKMDVEMEIQTELEIKNAQLRDSQELLRRKDQEIEEGRKEREQLNQEKEQLNQEIANRTRASVKALHECGMDAKSIASALGIDEGSVASLLSNHTTNP